jgi:mRNA-degrading endonuclease YafQ of YafQ-DinJ toxin-antitoxin module
MQLLAESGQLPPKYKQHKLSGDSLNVGNAILKAIGF